MKYTFINEAIETSNVSPVQQKLFELFIQTITPSLPEQILPEVKMTGPNGKVFALSTNETGDAKIISNQLDVIKTDAIKTSITSEALEDIYATQGENGLKVIANILRGRANDLENKEFQKFLAAKSFQAESPLDLSGLNAASAIFEITRYTAALVQKSNLDLFRTKRAWVVLPYNIAAELMCSNVYSAEQFSYHDSPFHVMSTPMLAVYSHFDPTITKGYLGVNNYEGEANCSAFMGKYAKEVLQTTSSDTNFETFFMYNRFGFVTNPLHDKERPMLWNFDCKSDFVK